MIYDGLIMIDMWEPRSDQDLLHQWYQSILHRLYPSRFKCIVNACYNVAINYEVDRSQYNTMRIYNNLGDNCGRHKNYNQNDQLLLNILHNCRGMNSTSQIIKQQLLNNDNSIFLTNVEDFVHHWGQVLKQQVNNWLVIGQAWQLCVHNRPIGLKQLSELSKQYPLKFYGTIWGFVDENHKTLTHKHFARDSLSWTRISHGTYELGNYK